MTNITELTAKLKASLTRNRHNWSDSVMRICNHCGQWEMTVIGNDAMTICASCCDAEYASDLASNLELATEALEAAEKQRDSWRTLAKQNIAEREKDIAALDESRQRIADLESKLAQSESWSVSAQNYIASLEARTLTVKLPHWSGYTCSGEGAMLDACVRSLESQGFTVQIEGE